MVLQPGEKYRITDNAGTSLVGIAVDDHSLSIQPGLLLGWCNVERLEFPVNGPAMDFIKIERIES